MLTQAALVFVVAFGFANPWLLAGLALGSVPILIHLLYRRAYRETDWAAMRFLIEAARKNSRRMRLEQIVLLAVRTLTLILVATAFAEPLVEAIAPQRRSREPVHRLLVLDASYSMGAQVDGTTRFERARGLARQVVSESLAGDAINVLRIAQRARRAVVREPAFERDPVLAAIDRLERTDEPGDLAATLTEVLDALADPRAPARKEVLFFSDMQRTTWAAADGRAGLREAFQRIADRARIVLIDVGDPGSDNAAITSLDSAEPIALVDRPTRIRAAIRNYGPLPRRALRVELYVDGYPTAFKTIDVPGGNEAVVEFPQVFRSAGEHAAEVRIPADRLDVDNQRWLSAPVAQRMNVLIVNGREGGRPAEAASHYVRTALAPSTTRDAWTSAFQPTVINEADLAAQDLSRYDCVFLCNVALVTPTEAALLQTFAEGGGGVVVALGDRVRPENYNAMLYRGGAGVLPTPLVGSVGDARDAARGGFTFAEPDLNHPILAPFRGNPRAGLNRPVTLQYIKTGTAPESTARVLLRFNSGDAAIAERSVGRGRCVLVTTAADVSWGVWPVHSTFPPIVHEAVRFACAGRWNERQRLVGESLTLALSDRDAAAVVSVKSPGGSETTLHAAPRRSRSEVVFADTNRRGLYEMALGPSPAVRRAIFAVNVDPRESDLATVDAKALGATTLAGIPFTLRNQWSEAPRAVDGPAADASGPATWLLVAAFGLLVVEPLLAWSFRHGLILLGVLALAPVVLPFSSALGSGRVAVVLLAAVAVVAVALLGWALRSGGEPPIAGRRPARTGWRRFIPRPLRNSAVGDPRDSSDRAR